MVETGIPRGVQFFYDISTCISYDITTILCSCRRYGGQVQRYVLTTPILTLATLIFDIISGGAVSSLLPHLYLHPSCHISHPILHLKIKLWEAAGVLEYRPSISSPAAVIFTPCVCLRLDEEKKAKGEGPVGDMTLSKRAWPPQLDLLRLTHICCLFDCHLDI